MCIAELGRILICLLVCAFFEARTAQAHPVSQGAMEIVIFPDRIEVQATVSMEEVLVAAAYSRQKKMSYLETVQSHGDYLRAHLRLTADGRALDGSVVKVPEKTQSPLTYALEYRLRGGAPACIDVQQDVLREFEFAPGNPWEASYLVRIGEAGQPAVEGLLLTSKAPLRFDCEWGRAAGAPGLDQAQMATAFVRHGITHILTGYDHLLFVGALVLAVVNLWDLVKVIGAFTLAHTITLTLAALDVFRLPGSIVEPMIAASIVFVAVQNVFWPKQSRSGSRLLVAFLFGLFHGLGFAGGLLEAMSGLRAAGALVAIMAFSAGVEIGHQLVVLPAFCALRLLRRVRAGAYRHDWLVQRYGSAVISLGGMIYLVAALR
jgi:HupE / UreJ protein